MALVRLFLALAIALIASPVVAQTAAPSAPITATAQEAKLTTVTIAKPYQLTYFGKWTCMITSQGGVPKAGEANSIKVEKGTDRISFTASHTYGLWRKWPIQTYNFCQFGGGRGVKSTPSLAIRVGDAGFLEQPFSWRIEGGFSGNFNVLAETFLTSTPTDSSSGNLEVGFQLRDDWALNQWLKQKWPKSCKQPCEPGQSKAKSLGSFIDRRGKRWFVVAAGGPTGPHGFINIRPASPTTMNEGVLPWGEALAFLVKAGVASPDWYMNGAHFGLEVTSGRATVRVEVGGLRCQGAVALGKDC